MFSWLKIKQRKIHVSVTVTPQGLFALSFDPSKWQRGEPAPLLACTSLPTTQLTVKSLSQLASQLRVEQASWLLTLEHQDYQTLTLNEPALPADELERGLLWLTSEQLGVDVQTLNLDWLRVSRPERNNERAQQLFIFAAQKSLIDAQQQTFRDAGQSLNVVDCQETAQRNIANLVAEPDVAVAMLRIADTGFEFTLSHQGELHFHRWIPSESVQLEGDSDSETPGAERLVLQLQRSLDHIDRHYSYLTLHDLCLAPHRHGAGIENFIGRHLTLPLRRINLGELFDFSLTPALMENAAQADYFAPLGACLRFLDAEAA